MEQEERFAKIEDVMARLVDRTDRLDEVMLTLAESHVKLMANLDRIAQEWEERDRRLGQRIDAVNQGLDERIQALVSAMGGFIRNRPAAG
jgi:ElaB/YqjD/DUF883 family membrane-anchored ribosome-binding protein